MEIDKFGQLATKRVEFFLGDPHNTFCVILAEIGRSFRNGNILQGGLSRSGDPDRHHILYYHETRHYANRQCLTYSPVDFIYSWY
jgi:hypothetical protein